MIARPDFKNPVLLKGSNIFSDYYQRLLSQFAVKADFSNPVLQKDDHGEGVLSPYWQRLFSALFDQATPAPVVVTPPAPVPGVDIGPYLYRIPYAAHVPSPGGPVIDGNGNSQDGNHAPMQDLLIGILNTQASAQVIRLRFIKGDGSPALWGDGAAFRDYTLGAGHSVATTLIPGNIFVDPPQNFTGYCTLETAVDLPIYSLLGGGSYFPNHWNDFSLEVPVYRSFAARSTWNFPYLIPYFQDGNHFGPLSYRTQLVITNFDVIPASFWITFTVADFYGAPGTSYLAKQTVMAGHSLSIDTYTLLQTAGYPALSNSEGWLNITAHASDVSTALLSLKACPYLMVWNQGQMSFSAGERFWE